MPIVLRTHADRLRDHSRALPPAPIPSPSSPAQAPPRDLYDLPPDLREVAKWLFRSYADRCNGDGPLVVGFLRTCIDATCASPSDAYRRACDRHNCAPMSSR